MYYLVVETIGDKVVSAEVQVTFLMKEEPTYKRESKIRSERERGRHKETLYSNSNSYK